VTSCAGFDTESSLYAQNAAEVNCGLAFKFVLYTVRLFISFLSATQQTLLYKVGVIICFYYHFSVTCVLDNVYVYTWI